MNIGLSSAAKLPILISNRKKVHRLGKVLFIFNSMSRRRGLQDPERVECNYITYDIVDFV
jgi:hypothetical protein